MGANQSTAFSPRSTSLRSKLGEPQVLTSYQKVILRTAWRHMSKSGQSSCGNIIMRRLFIRNDRIKNVFHHNTMINGILKAEEMHSVQQHYKEIVGFLQFVISNLDYPSKITERCHEIGLLHRKYKEMGMKTEHWDLLGEAITETIREYQGWKRHRESLRAANILVSFLVDRIRTGFLQRDVATPNGTPPVQRILKEVPDRERSKSLQYSYHGLLHCEWTDSCPSIKGSLSPVPSRRRKESPKPKRSLPCMSTSKETRLEMQIHRRRCLPQTPLSDGELDDNGNTVAMKKRQQFRHTTNSSFELGHLSK
ncbi:hypothetical protein Y032_0053g2383 [Ancylostoma ceylanicum]|uniref:Globin domain-containing protein n=1 Tax=Ancylostoma ceylanicum TaxID=53326 RepID=A0A016U6J3_9BILA|nr:hypothetical protein Y032_0053g2383 [Ancylostoma ceylanicum]